MKKKVVKAKAKGRPGEEDAGKDEVYQLFRSIVDAPKMKRPKFDEATAAKNFEIGRTYNIESRKFQDRFMAQLQLKLDLQQFAIKSLPPHLAAHATQHDDLPLPPIDRRWWTWTPPIPGFQPDDHIQEDD